jgi:hypothetical protein
MHSSKRKNRKAFSSSSLWLNQIGGLGQASQIATQGLQVARRNNQLINFGLNIPNMLDSLAQGSVIQSLSTAIGAAKPPSDITAANFDIAGGGAGGGAP